MPTKNETAIPIEWAPLRLAQNYRAFLRAYLDHRSLRYSEFARMTGFARGFPGDVISGRRRLTNKSFHAFEQALKIPAPGRKLFRFLVAIEEPDIFPELKKNIEQITSHIEKLRMTPWGPSRRDVLGSQAPRLEIAMQNPNVLPVYAASGLPGNGATLDQIQSRTRLSKEEVYLVLSNLISAGIVKQNREFFEPMDLHLFLKTSEQNRIFTAVFKMACDVTARRSEVAMGSSDEMFFTSAFCVDTSRLAELKKELRETILKFVDDSISPNGDTVVRLVTALHK